MSFIKILKRITRSFLFYFYKKIGLSRHISPILLGLIVGVCLNILSLEPVLYYNDCTSTHQHDKNQNSILKAYYFNNHSSSLLARYQVDDEQQIQNRIDEFEPRINLEGKLKQAVKPIKKLNRPRHISTELNIRKRLLIAILLRDQNDELISWYNSTLTKHCDKVTFFILKKTKKNPNIIELTLTNGHSFGLKTLEYIINYYLNDYNWFLIINDETFVRTSKLSKLLDHISIGEHLYLGNHQFGESCDITGGILLSNSIIQRIHLKRCTGTIGECIYNSTNLTCSSNVHKFSIKFNNIQKNDFNESITISNVLNLNDLKELNYHFLHLDLIAIRQQINQFELKIIKSICNTPGGCDSYSWPPTVHQPEKATNRFDLIKWEYFNETHSFQSDDNHFITKLDGKNCNYFFKNSSN
jgi:hypothetical protein